MCFRPMASVRNAFVLCALFTMTTHAAPKKPPAQGWCRTRHKPLKPAQTGYRGYCKNCFLAFYPDEYASKQEARKQHCRFCGASRDLVAGSCRPCLRVRTCESCSSISEEVHPTYCRHCRSQRASIGARGPRFALWCPLCTTVEERDLQCCRACLRDSAPSLCGWCSTADQGPLQYLECNEADCDGGTLCCTACAPAFAASAARTCISCWRRLPRSERLCIVCSLTVARDDKMKRRCCDMCYAKHYCGSCDAPHPAERPPQCVACKSATAMWCESCHPDEAREIGVCTACHENTGSCYYCHGSSSPATTQWRPCQVDACGSQVSICDICVRAHVSASVKCSACWRQAGGKCIICDQTPAQNHRRFLHRCKECMTNNAFSGAEAFLAEEVAAHEDSLAKERGW